MTNLYPNGDINVYFCISQYTFLNLEPIMFLYSIKLKVKLLSLYRWMSNQRFYLTYGGIEKILNRVFMQKENLQPQKVLYRITSC